MADGTALFRNGLSIVRGNYTHLASRVVVRSLFILDIHLDSLGVRGGPGHLLSEMLYPHYEPYNDPDMLCYRQHAICYSDPTYRKTFESELSGLGKRAQGWVFYFWLSSSLLKVTLVMIASLFSWQHTRMKLAVTYFTHRTLPPLWSTHVAYSLAFCAQPSHTFIYLVLWSDHG